MKPRMLNRHMLVMLLCCLVPLAVLGVALLLGVSFGSALTLGLILLCPLGHVLMMLMMAREDHEHRADHAHGEHENQEVAE